MPIKHKIGLKRKKGDVMKDTFVRRFPKEKTLGRTVQEYRQKYGWTQDELAWRMSMTRVQIGRIERDECVPTVATVEKLEKALQIPPLTLMRVREIAETDDGVKRRVGKTLREFEKEVVKNMTETELESMCKTISVFTNLMKK